MTFCQLLAAALVVLPYTFIFENNSSVELSPNAVLALITVCILHTGIAYLLYFASVKELSAQTVAVFSYIDPIVAILLSVFLLGESASPSVIVGAVIILASTLASELNFGKKA